MSMEYAETIRKDKRSKTHHGSPRKPAMITDIIYLRDRRLATWQEIGDMLGMTRAGVRGLYYKWHEWVRASKRKTRLRTRPSEQIT